MKLAVNDGIQLAATLVSRMICYQSTFFVDLKALNIYMNINDLRIKQ